MKADNNPFQSGSCLPPEYQITVIPHWEKLRPRTILVAQKEFLNAPGYRNTRFCHPYKTFYLFLKSLYSTATQNHWCWVLPLVETPNATLLRHLTQNIPTCWYILTLPNAKICVTPNANP